MAETGVDEAELKEINWIIRNDPKENSK